MTTNLAVVNELDNLKVQCLKFRFDNLKVAKKYFALAAQKSGFASNRALLGVIVTSEQLIK